MSKKVRIFLLLSFFIFGLSLLGVLLYFVNQNNALTTTDASVGMNAGCSTTADCDSGLVCVNYSGANKVCSNLAKGQVCDKTTKLCANDMDCVNTQSTGENFSCTDHANYGGCNIDSDCDTGLKCIASWGGAGGVFWKTCSNLNPGSYCDHTSKACNNGGLCVNFMIGTQQNWVCGNKQNGTVCSTVDDCNTGLKCVVSMTATAGTTVFKYKHCTNTAENAPCDMTSKECGAGLTCKNTGTATAESWKCVKDSSVVNEITCGNSDANADKKIDIVDFAKFAATYGKTCK